MKKLGSDEQAKRVQVVRDGDKIVDVTCFVKDEGRDSKTRYQMSFALDFSGCSAAEIIDLAATSCRISIQDDWRRSQSSQRFKSELWERTWSVKRDIVDAVRTRKSIDPFSAAMAGLATFTPEQIVALQTALSAAKTSKK